MNDPGAIVVLAITVCSAAAFAVKVIADAAVKYRAQEHRAPDVPLSTVSDERFARLEMAVEAIAVEVERISEGQRFTTRLLNEQAQRAVPKLQPPGKVNTPH
jgi:hypothetical protein